MDFPTECGRIRGQILLADTHCEVCSRTKIWVSWLQTDRSRAMVVPRTAVPFATRWVESQWRLPPGHACEQVAVAIKNFDFTGSQAAWSRYRNRVTAIERFFEQVAVATRFTTGASGRRFWKSRQWYTCRKLEHKSGHTRNVSGKRKFRISFLNWIIADGNWV